MSALKLSAPVVIFVRPQAAGNIGALARVMSNFAIEELRLVGPAPLDADSNDSFSKMDWALSCKGRSVLDATKRYPDLGSALEGLHVALGSSGKKDNFFELGYARPFVSPTRALAALCDETLHNPELSRWAFVLGPEDDGLSAEEASLCQKLVHIDTCDQNPSINLAMAAGLFLYHWHLFNLGEISPEAPSRSRAVIEGQGAFALDAGDRLATLDEKEALLNYAIEALKPTQFFKTPDIGNSRARLRRWLQSAPAPLNDLRVVFEALYQLKCKAQGHFEARDFLKRS
jgi:tRNA/rRNA methyltransferase